MLHRIAILPVLSVAFSVFVVSCGGGGGGNAGGGIVPGSGSGAGATACTSTPAAPCFTVAGGTQVLPVNGGLSASLTVPAGESAPVALTAAVSSVAPSSLSWARPLPFAAPTLYLQLARTAGPQFLTYDATLSIAASSFPSGTSALQIVFFSDGKSGAAPVSAAAPPIVLAVPDKSGAFALNLPFGTYSGTIAIAPLSTPSSADCTALSFGESCLTPTSGAGTAVALAIGVNDPTATTPSGAASTISTYCSSGNTLSFSNSLHPTVPNALAVSSNGNQQPVKTLSTIVSFALPIQCDYLAPAVLYGSTFWFAGSVDSNVPLSPSPTLSDDWVTYAHDDSRTGFEQNSGINSANVSQLTLAWRQSGAMIDAPCIAEAQRAQVYVDEASPIVADGFVYTADVCGVVTALRRDSGEIAWQTHLPLATDLGGTVTPAASVSGVYGTPTLDTSSNTLLVPVEGIQSACATLGPPPSCVDYAHGGYVAALNAQTGAVDWMEPSQSSGGAPGLAYGNMRGEPIVVNGDVIEGIAGGDPDSGDINGGLIAMSESTGKIIAQYQIAPPGGAPYGQGGSSWAPISYDGNYLYTGTGNSVNNVGDFDGVVQFVPSTLTPTASYIPTYATNPASTSPDSDVGGGVLLWNGNLYFTGKSGYYYGYPIYNPNLPLFPPVLVTLRTPAAGFGGIGTPTTDGQMIAISSGRQGNGYSSNLDLFPVGSGTEHCSLTATNSILFAYAAWVPGIAFTPLDNGVPNGQSGAAPAFLAFDDNCAVVWRANPTDLLQFFYGGPAVVASGVYAIDVAQNVYAWKLPSTVGVQASRRANLIRPAARVKFVFRHFIPKGLRGGSP